MDQSHLSKAAYESRGRILQLAIEVEKAIEIYIAEYFNKNETKVSELINLILAPRMTLSQKQDVFDYLMRKYNPEFLVRYEKIYGQFGNLIFQRNVFAHWPVDFSPESLSAFNTRNVITLVKLKNYKDQKTKESVLMGKLEYSESDTNYWIQLFLDFNVALRDLINNMAPPSGK